MEANKVQLQYGEEANVILMKNWHQFSEDQQTDLMEYGSEGHTNSGVFNVARCFFQSSFTKEDTREILIPIYATQYGDQAEFQVGRVVDKIWDGNDLDFGDDNGNVKTEDFKFGQKWSKKPKPATRQKNFNNVTIGMEPLQIDPSLAEIKTSQFLDLAYGKKDRVVISHKNKGVSQNRAIEEQLGDSKLNTGHYCYLIPNVVTAAQGFNQQGRESTRSKDICTPDLEDLWLVLENDEQSHEEQLKFFNKLVHLGVPLAFIVDSRNKSHHGWLSLVGLSRRQIHNLKRFFVNAGFDPSPMRTHQLVRLVGGHRDGEEAKRQNLLYLNKEAILAPFPIKAMESLDVSFSDSVDEPGTDLEEADVFLNYLSGEFVYAVGHGWYRFDEHHWCEVHKSVVERKYFEYLRQMKNTGLIQRSKGLSYQKKVSDVLKLCQSELTRPIKFDSDPNLLGVKNGVINLQTLDFRNGFKSDYISKTLNTKYDSSKDAPTWERFIARILRSKPNLLPFIQRVIGLTLTGSVDEQVFFFFYGMGRNGKSTLVNAIASLMGDYAKKVQQSSYIKGRKSADESSLEYYGSRFAYGEEIEASVHLAEASIKNLTGGDKMLVKKLYSDRFEFDPTHKLFLFGNYKPMISGSDVGIWRRIVLIPFDEQISHDEKISNLPQLLNDELAGILNWALKGLEDYQKNGLQQPVEITDAVSEYKTDEDTLAEFINEYLDLTDDKARTPKSDVYRAYTYWNISKQSLSPKSFTAALRGRGIHPISNNYPLKLKQDNELSEEIM